MGRGEIATSDLARDHIGKMDAEYLGISVLRLETSLQFQGPSIAIISKRQLVQLVRQQY